MIILEGPDLSGKSTIGKKLETLLGMPIYHFGGPPIDGVDLKNRIEYAPKNYIYDRHPAISEQVYGTLKGRQSVIPPTILTQHLIDNDPLIFYCDPGLEYLETKLHCLNTKPHKKEDHVRRVKENYTYIYNKYEEVMTSLSYVLMVVKVDFRYVTNEQLKGKINEYFRR